MISRFARGNTDLVSNRSTSGRATRTGLHKDPVSREHHPNSQVSDVTEVPAPTGPGWGRAGPHGASTRGGESRLVLPMQGAGHSALVLTFEAIARAKPTNLDVLVNGRRQARIRVGHEASVYRLDVQAGPSSQRHPVEIAFRGTGRLFSPRLPRLFIRRVELDRATVTASLTRSGH